MTHRIADPETRIGGVAPDRALAALRRADPAAQAFYLYDLDAIEAGARRFVAAFASLEPFVGFALKANALPAILAVARDAGVGAEAGSLGELAIARRAGFEGARTILNGNGRTTPEAEWAVRHGIHSVNVDHVGELDLLERHAAAHGASVRASLRVNPGILTPGHRYVATGDDEAKFGIAPDEALAAWAARARWPHLRIDGIHLHVGSQVLDLGPLERALATALELAEESARRGAPLQLLNLGGGFGVDYAGGGAEFPLERYAQALIARLEGQRFDLAFEPGRWLVARAGILVSEVLWVKRRGGKRFIVLAAGMNDLIRPALYAARHRIVAVHPRPGATEAATIVGPVCESADVFDARAEIGPLEAGDLVAILDAGAYGATMASNYNGRGRLAELVARGGALTLARAAEGPEDMAARDRDVRLDL